MTDNKQLEWRGQRPNRECDDFTWKGQRSSRKKHQFPCVNHGFPCSICSNMAERENLAEKGEVKGPEVEEREEKYGPWQCIKCDFQGDKDSVIHHHLDMHYPHRDIPFTCVKCGYKTNVRGKAWRCGGSLLWNDEGN